MNEPRRPTTLPRVEASRATWFVSARHRLARSGGGAGRSGTSVPYGLAHARQVGSRTTACGEWAHTWPFFWHLRFDVADEQSCDECVRVLVSLGIVPRG